MFRQKEDPRQRQALLENPLQADFHQLVEDAQLRQAWIKAMMECGTEQGYPRKLDDEEVPECDYEYNKAQDRINVHKPSNKLCHPRLRFCRKVSHAKAVHALLRAGLSPTIITQTAEGTLKTTLTLTLILTLTHTVEELLNNPYDNIVVCKYTYYIFYVDAEGITNAHKLAR